jgi:hypothetical protein
MNVKLYVLVRAEQPFDHAAHGGVAEIRTLERFHKKGRPDAVVFEDVEQKTQSLLAAADRAGDILLADGARAPGRRTRLRR